MRNATWLLISLFVFWTCGCSSSSQTKTEKDDTSEFIHSYERTFDPSDYDESPSREQPAKNDEGIPIKEVSPESDDSELVPGFRVQVSFTDNVEQANKVRDELSAKLAGHSVYVVFETPYYKVRVGDFLSRPEANLTLKDVIDAGYKDAWIVPDKVRKLQY